jgi:hypothetical protein
VADVHQIVQRFEQPLDVRQVQRRGRLTGSLNFAVNIEDCDINDRAFGGKHEEMQNAAVAFPSAALEH